MVHLMPSQYQVLQYAEHDRRFAEPRFHGLGAALLVFGLVLSWLQIATAQQQPSDLQRHKMELEVQKLELEVKKLKAEAWPAWLNWLQWLQPWQQVLLGGVVGTLGTVWVARRTRAGGLDQATHEKRLEAYPQLVKAASPLALYFPGAGPAGTASVGPAKCHAMGREMSRWYFERGGLLLSVQARIAYFRLARALTRASLANELKVPSFPRDALDISEKKVGEYRDKLGQELKLALKDVDEWKFGRSASETEGSDRKPHREFKDYVFLQELSSDLRTKLSKDLRSRRRPS